MSRSNGRCRSDRPHRDFDKRNVLLSGTVTTAADFPILAFRRSQGDDVLVGYQLTPLESSLFREMDSAGLELPVDADLDRYYSVIVPIGAKHGLDAAQSIAFWTRTTLSSFEP